METTITVNLKWWHFSQNNSGGRFIDNDVVSHDVFIQARNADEADAIASRIFEPYSDYCGCCGERWYINSYEDEGVDEPTRYGEALSQVKKDMFNRTYILHHFDGRVEKGEYQ